MSQYFSLHPVNPQIRLIRRAVEILRMGEAGDSCEHRSHPAERPAKDGGAGKGTRDGS
jgi:hypothetical protein